MRINLGSGNYTLPGYVNVDQENNWCNSKPEVYADISKPLPFEDNSADEIKAIHVLEHFPRYEVDQILENWIRVLKPGGVLILELPCLDKILDIFRFVSDRGMELPENLTMWGLYGDPKYRDPAMIHKWCYSESELTQMLQLQGMKVEVKEPETHKPVRDMRLECTKLS